MMNLLVRTITGLILAPLAIWVIIAGGNALAITVVVASFIMYFEWCNVTKTSPRRVFWWLGGVYYVFIPAFVILVLAHYRQPFFGHPSMPLILLSLVVVVWLTDIGGYIFGRAVGGPKIAPKISPNKTWAGLLGGIILSLTFYLIQNIFEPFRSLYENDRLFGICTILYTIVPILAQIGDFFESWVKRRFGVKDSGVLIPGHGGLLDRLDGLLFVCHLIGIFIFVRIVMIKYFPW